MELCGSSDVGSIPTGRTCQGEVREWLNRTVSKTVVGETSPWVRIPPSPPGPHSSTDRTKDSGSFDGGSIPPGGTYETGIFSWRDSV